MQECRRVCGDEHHVRRGCDRQCKSRHGRENARGHEHARVHGDRAWRYRFRGHVRVHGPLVCARGSVRENLPSFGHHHALHRVSDHGYTSRVRGSERAHPLLLESTLPVPNLWRCFSTWRCKFVPGLIKSHFIEICMKYELNHLANTINIVNSP